ncbi:MAG: hypothetical protein DMG49_00180 [Acidobacteria bacterium]|nr:MAG: hypothetical protein DMG49_00180 [Acidobacteriota bacterium]
MIPQPSDVKSERNPIAKVSELIADLPESISTDIQSSARPRDFKTGDVLFCSGDPADEIFLLTKGRVKITQVSGRGLEVVPRLDLLGEIIGRLGLGP